MPSRMITAPRRVSPMLGTGAERDRNRAVRVTWRAWYDTAEWKALRRACLHKALYTCAFCGRIEGSTSLLVADHIRRHDGDHDLFFDATNLQCLCKPCHDQTKQRLERKGGGGL